MTRRRQCLCQLSARVDHRCGVCGDEDTSQPPGPPRTSGGQSPPTPRPHGPTSRIPGDLSPPTPRSHEPTPRICCEQSPPTPQPHVPTPLISDGQTPPIPRPHGRPSWLPPHPIPAVSMITLTLVTLATWSPYPPPQYPQDVTPAPPGTDHQTASLLHNYTLPWQDILNTRLLNMKRYPYPYNTYGIDRRSNLSLQEFWDVYDGKWPVLITDVVPEWPASNWTRQFFLQNYGKERVVMKAVDHTWDTAIHNILSDNLDLITHGLDLQLPSIPSKGSLASAVTLALPMELFHRHTDQVEPKQWTYIEDELFIQTHPELRNDIRQTVYLEDDLYDEFPVSVRPWNAMLLWGTLYSRSSLHIDPYNWTGTNAVLSGRKRWKLYHPGQDDKLYMKNNQRSGFPLDCFKYNSLVDAFDVDLAVHPDSIEVDELTFDQMAGELLIIPTGWLHQAFNVEETLAISSQVMNKNNYRVVLEEIIKAGNLDRDKLPEDLHHSSPIQQVRTVMSHLSEDTLARGREVTENTIWQTNMGYNQQPHSFSLH